MFCQNSVDDGQNDDRGEGSGEGDQSSISFVFADKKGVILPRRKYHTFFVGFRAVKVQVRSKRGVIFVSVFS